MPSEHARVGASSLHRTLRCPGSVYLAEAEPERRESFFAAEGTVAHHVRETCLEVGFGPGDFLGDTLKADGFEIEVEQEMVDALQPGIDWINERAEGGELVIEMKVYSGDEMPGQFGTLDCGIITDDLIIVNDLKYGAGVPVGAEENEQLMAYALWFYDTYARQRTNAKDFLLVIDQPRVVGGWSEWEVSLDRLLEFKETLRESFDLIFPPGARDGDDPDAWLVSPDAPLSAGDKQCRFCPAKGWCAELARHSLEVMSLKFDDLDDEGLSLADADEFTPGRRSVIVKNAELVRKWLDAVHARVLRDALAGDPTPGLKATVGRRGNKAWIDERKAGRFLLKKLGADKVFTDPKLITPTQAEDLLKSAGGAEALEPYWVQPAGKPVLVDEDSPKPALVMADKFED